jgi:putative transposase
MIDRTHPLPVTRQCQLLKVARSTASYEPVSISPDDLALMRRIDERHLESPFAGVRRLRDLLRKEEAQIGCKRVRTLMRKMGIEALYPKPRTRQRGLAHPVLPDLQRDLTIDRPNHVWVTDITYIPMRRQGC